MRNRMWATGNVLLFVAAAVAVMLPVAGCSGDEAIEPTSTVPEYHRYMWAVISDGYTPAVGSPNEDGEVAAVLREGEVFRIHNLRAGVENRHGVIDRWYELDIPEVGKAWVFGTAFRGFYTREQALQFAEGKAD